MLTTEQLCSHLIRIIHAPIRVYSGEGERIRVYVDAGEQQDPLSCDPRFEQELLALVREKTAAVYLEIDSAVYAVLRADTQERYVLGPCSVGSGGKSMADRLQKVHRMDTGLPYRISR